MSLIQQLGGFYLSFRFLMKSEDQPTILKWKHGSSFSYYVSRTSPLLNQLTSLLPLLLTQKLNPSTISKAFTLAIAYSCRRIDGESINPMVMCKNDLTVHSGRNGLSWRWMSEGALDYKKSDLDLRT